MIGHQWVSTTLVAKHANYVSYLKIYRGHEGHPRGEVDNVWAAPTATGQQFGESGEASV